MKRYLALSIVMILSLGVSGTLLAEEATVSPDPKPEAIEIEWIAPLWMTEEAPVNASVEPATAGVDGLFAKAVPDPNRCVEGAFCPVPGPDGCGEGICRSNCTCNCDA